MNGAFRRRPQVLFRLLGSELVLAPPGRDDFELASPPAAAVWELLRVPRTLEELAGIVAEASGQPPVAIVAEVGAFLGYLRERDLVEEVMAGGV